MENSFTWTEWIYDSNDPALGVVLSVVGIFIVLGVCTRLAGLRSLSQMTGFDFGVNVAIGSIIAACVVAPDPSLTRAGLALVTIFVMQVVYSWLRRVLPGVGNPSSQKPHLLWIDGDFIDKNMKATHYTRSDVYQAMRTAKVNNFDEVRFVIAEPTGTVSVFKGGDGPVAREIFDDVVGIERMPTT